MAKTTKCTREFDIHIHHLWYYLDFQVNKTIYPEHIVKRIDRLIHYLEDYIYQGEDIAPEDYETINSKFLRTNFYK